MNQSAGYGIIPAGKSNDLNALGQYRGQCAAPENPIAMLSGLAQLSLPSSSLPPRRRLGRSFSAAARAAATRSMRSARSMLVSRVFTWATKVRNPLRVPAEIVQPKTRRRADVDPGGSGRSGDPDGDVVGKAEEQGAVHSLDIARSRGLRRLVANDLPVQFLNRFADGHVNLGNRPRDGQRFDVWIASELQRAERGIVMGRIGLTLPYYGDFVEGRGMRGVGRDVVNARQLHESGQPPERNRKHARADEDGRRSAHRARTAFVPDIHKSVSRQGYGHDCQSNRSAEQFQGERRLKVEEAVPHKSAGKTKKAKNGDAIAPYGLGGTLFEEGQGVTPAFGLPAPIGKNV